MLELMRSNGIDDEHNTSAGDGELCSESIHRRRKNSNVEPLLVDDGIPRQRKMDAIYVRQPCSSLYPEEIIDDEHNTSAGDSGLYSDSTMNKSAEEDG